MDNRKAYIEAQKKQGKKIFGIFPIYYPKEILTAYDILAVEVWDPPNINQDQARGKLQPFICSIVKVGLEFIMEGKAKICDGFLMPHTCDSLQNNATLIKDFLKLEKPAFYFYHPKGGHERKSTQEFYKAELQNLIDNLETLYGNLDKEKLISAIKAHNKANELKAQMFSLRREGKLKGNDKDFYKTLRKEEYMFIDDYITELENYLKQNKSDSKIHNKIPIVMSGIIPHPEEIFDLFEENNTYVADDDFAVTGRRLYPSVQVDGDPLDALVKQYFDSPPCPTKCHTQRQRYDFIKNKIDAAGAKGVVFYNVKFCEPESYDHPFLTDSLRKNNIPNLVLETEINETSTGQIKTRFEAFVEILQ